jgi:hypothetical protein
MKSVGISITGDTATRNASNTRSGSIRISRVSLAFFLTAVMACASVLLSMSVSMFYAHGDSTVVCAPPMALILAGIIFTVVTGSRLASKILDEGSAVKRWFPLSRSLYVTLINLWCSSNRWACVTACKAKVSEPKKGEKQNGRSHAS